MVRFLSACQAKTGGFGGECLTVARDYLCMYIHLWRRNNGDILLAGGPGQNAHLATTYAAVMSLCIVGTEAAYKSIDR